MLKRTVHGTGYSIDLDWTDEQIKTVEHAVAAFSWILPSNKMITWKQFADLITDYCKNDKAKFVADVLKSL